MSRDWYPYDLNMPQYLEEGGRRSVSNGERTPRSNFSTGFESSAFGSGSSVLSSFEPPTDAEVFEKTKLTQLLDDNSSFPGSLEELQSTIQRLQAIYFYRQGLKALADEMMLNQGAQTGGYFPHTGQFVPPPGFPSPDVMAPPSIPGMEDSIWRVDDQLSVAARAVEAAAAELSATAEHPLQNSMQHELLLRNPNNGHQFESAHRGSRRKSRRQHSCPVALAPQWADASWNPRSSVKPNLQSASHGTGVFLPQQLSGTNTPNARDDNGRSHQDLHA